MRHLPQLLAAQLGALLLLSALVAPAFAGTTVLKTAEAAQKYCALSASTAPEDHDAESYDVQRRAAAQQQIEVLLTADVAPVVRYDNVTSTLQLHIPRGAEFAPGFAIDSTRTAAVFELTQEDAHLLWARYDAGSAALRVTMLPNAWSDYDRPLCQRDGEQTLLGGELLTAQLVDEAGRTLTTFQSPLGREVALMKQHRIRGYLAASTPVVSIADIAVLPKEARASTNASAGQTATKRDQLDRVKSDLRAALYGCYLRGLTDNGRLQGALVLKLEQGEATVLVDSLHSEATRNCALERVTKCWRDGDESLKATVIFRLEDASL